MPVPGGDDRVIETRIRLRMRHAAAPLSVDFDLVKSRRRRARDAIKDRRDPFLLMAYSRPGSHAADARTGSVTRGLPHLPGALEARMLPMVSVR